MEYNRAQDRLNSTTPIYSRIVSLAHPTRQLKYEYMRKDLHNCSADHLASRLLEQIEEHDKLKIIMVKVENRNIELERDLQKLMALCEERNVDQMKLAQIQEKNSEKIKRLQQEISVKVAELNTKTHWENRYKELDKYMTIYTSEIGVMQEKFRSQYANISAQLQNTQAKLNSESSLREDLNLQISQLKSQVGQLQQECIRLVEEKKQYENTCFELDEQNKQLLASSKTFSNELEKCTELIDKLFTEIKEKGLQLKEKNENISYLEKHLNNSVDEIEKLNDMLRNSIDSDNKAIHEIQRLDLKVSESKNALQLLKMQMQEKLGKINTLENEIKSLLQTNDLMKQMTRDLESKLVTALANQQHYRALLEERQQKIQQFESQLSLMRKDHNKKTEEYQNQLKHLKREIEENATLHRQELEGNSQILQELEKYKKQGARKNMLLSSIKEQKKQERGKQFRLNDFQMKLDHYGAVRSGFEVDSSSREIASSDLSKTRSRTGRDTSPEGLRRIVEEISHKVKELADVQANMNLRHSTQPQQESEEQQPDSEQDVEVNS